VLHIVCIAYLPAIKTPQARHATKEESHPPKPDQDADVPDCAKRQPLLFAIENWRREASIDKGTGNQRTPRHCFCRIIIT